uniref:Uncharacterized protein n=1 Tax=Lygus hesperus TaxID=30085 RepID=A0A0A9WK76_LYGHE
MENTVISPLRSQHIGFGVLMVHNYGTSNAVDTAVSSAPYNHHPTAHSDGGRQEKATVIDVQQSAPPSGVNASASTVIKLLRESNNANETPDTAVPTGVAAATSDGGADTVPTASSMLHNNHATKNSSAKPFQPIYILSGDGGGKSGTGDGGGGGSGGGVMGNQQTSGAFPSP